MADKQAWMTYASSDPEGLKALVLGRSLRQSITRRKLGIFISSQVSEEIVKLLEDEFDSCVRIRKADYEKEFPDETFSAIAQAYCWKLKRVRKFAFLDCNSLVLKNADELFRNDGVKQTKSANGNIVVSVIVGRPGAYDNDLNPSKILEQHTKNTEQLNVKFTTQIDLLTGFQLTANQMKIVHFMETHPLDLIFLHKETLIQGLDDFERCLVKLCLDLVRVKEISCEIVNNGTTFAAKVNLAKSYLKNTDTTIIRNPDQKLMEELKDSVAIVGMSFRFPGANTIDEFWQLLINGGDGIIRVPDGRWNKDHCFIRGDNTKDTQAGFLKCPIDLIDGKFFGMNAAELAYMDPQQRLTLQVVWEGLENAGISGTGLKETLTGVFGGWWRNDYKEMLQEAGLSETEFFRAYMGNALGTLTGRISHFLELTGPSISTESGCSTSIVGIDMACNSLREENCDLALAVGSNLLLHPFSIDTMNAVIAVDGHCKTFDAKADGFGRAEGCGVLVLKRFADAASDGDRIWGVIRGSAVVQEGPSKSLGTPTVQCEALAMSLALERAGVQPKDVSFVETHGTGTPVGDPLEVAAVGQVYSKGRKEILTIGSVKTNIGHTESVSGIAGIVKTILSLQNEMIPPHLHLQTLNPEINLDVIPAQIPLEALKWAKTEGKPRIAGVSSFGITGTDAHVIVQETPETVSNFLDIFEYRPVQLLTISAKSPEGLDEYIETYKNYLRTTKEDLEDIEYTLNLGRGHFSNRLAVFGESKEEIIQKLEKKSYELKHIPSEGPKVCFLFTGQGSQYHGMAQDLYENSLIFRSHFDYCENLLTTEYGFSIKEAIWGQADTLSRTLYSQTSIFCVEYCLLKLWESWGVKANCVLGHSLGEFGAAVAAEILTFKDALKLVVTRSKLIDSLPNGKMLVIKEELPVVEKLMKVAFERNGFWLDIAAVNTSEQTVLAGDEAAVKHFSAFCKNNNLKTHILDSSHAFHSRHMDPVLVEYKKTADKITYATQTCEYVSGMEAKMMKPDEVNADYWVDHTREKVSFVDASKAALEAGCTHFLEIGPQPVLSAMILINSDLADTTSPITCLPSIRKKEPEWNTMMGSLAKLYVNGVEINWDNYHRFTDARKVDLPSYPFQLKSYWMELRSDGAAPIHPLVGAPVSNPSALKIFKSNIDVQRIGFLKDHVLGNKIIFPGAGYVEMCLVSGHSAMQCTEGNYCQPTAALTIEDFKIEAPLCLNEQEKTQLQVIVSSEDNGETRATIYSKLVLDKETHKWIKHASGVFSPFAAKWVGEEDFKKDSLENMKARCLEKIETEFSYNRLSEIGLKFGPTFQTLANLWKGDNEGLVELNVTEDPKRYICPPVMIDGMFQALLAWLSPDSKLQVPIAIQKFIYHGKITGETVFVHLKQNEKMDYVGVMMNHDGSVVAVMVGAELMETTVNNVMALVEAQRMPYPSMFDDVWREQFGPWERRTEAIVEENVENLTGFLDDAEKSATYNTPNDYEKIFLEKFYRLCGLYMLKATYELGLNFKVGETLDANLLTAQLQIQPSLKRLFVYVLLELTEDGYLKVLDEDDKNMTFQVVKALPTKSEVVAHLTELKNEPEIANAIDAKSVNTTADVLADILTGRQSGLSILFPEDSNTMGPAELYYNESKLHKGTSVIAEILFKQLVKVIQEGRGTSKSVVRILEIGAGTGSFTKKFLPHLLGDGASFYEYTYTDISPAFFPKGEKIFENSKMKVHYKVLNIEEDPTSQGFIPNHYDMVIASYVIHATKDIEKSLANAKNLLRAGGTIILTELTKPYRATNLFFGTLEGFWRFEDTELRPHHCELEVSKWGQVLKKLHFKDFAYTHYYSSQGAIISAEAMEAPYCIHHLPSPKKSWIVFAESSDISNFFTNKLKEMGRRVIIARRACANLQIDDTDTYPVESDAPLDIVRVFNAVGNEKDMEGILFLWTLDATASANNNYAQISQPFLTLCKILVEKDLHIKLHLVTRGNQSIDDNKVSQPASNIVIGMAKVLQNEHQALSIRCVDLDPSITADKVAEEGLAELFTPDGEITVAYRGNRRLIKRFVPWKVPNTALKFPKSNYFHLKLPSSLALSDLRFCPMELPPLKENQVEVQVKAYALNFRDLFAVMKPDPFFENVNTVGIDYSGVVTAVGPNASKLHVGDAVFGINLNGGAMPSHLQVDEEMLISLPSTMTFSEAATLPAVAATAFVCLVEVAKLKKEDTVLIHTASGGVGLCAVQIAQSKGCNIIATAGSYRKREYLKNLGIQHVFHSRNTNYEHDIRKALGGEGVDVVLNSLTGEGFKEASLAACNPNARFIEMSKLNVWTKEEVQELRPDVQYEVVDLSAMPESAMKENMKQIKSFVSEATIKPIPYVSFDAAEIREALTYLQKAKHIGKIVCVMPEVNGSSSEVQTHLFNDRSSYMITGGLGGIGLEVAKWMASSGAKNILLVGRNPPKEKTAEEIRKLISREINVRVMNCDVGDREQCAGLLEEIKSSGLPPLRGIMHAAGVLSDDLYHNQTWEKFETVFNPKVRGGWNLHELTLDYPLEHFIMFSSATANIGSVAQGNHSSANGFLDSLAAYRNSIGKPALTINWGQWGQVGVAADMEIVGLRPFTVLQGVSALEKAMQCQKYQITVLEAEFQMLRKHLPSTRRYLEELKTSSTGNQANLALDADKFWKQYDEAQNYDEKYDVVRKYMTELIRATLKMDDDEVIDEDANFQDMGMDSLMMIEMKNGLQASVGKRVKITVNAIRDCKTISQFSSRLVELISGVQEIPQPSKEELIQLIREDSILPEEIKPTAEPACKISQIRTVLITGVTGNFGPYILREISKRPEIEKIYCVVRDNRLFSPKERLRQMLADKKLLEGIDMERVECVSGDVTQPNLGLSEENYNLLAETVDAVFHLSVKASLEEYYCKSEHSSHSRVVNVFGTKEVLRFVCDKKTKNIFHASTTISTVRSDEDGVFAEDWPNEGEMDNQPNGAYPLSKFICDRLMAQAVERGIPSKAFRFPFMGGDSKLGGNVSVLDNHLMLRMMTYMHLGIMPARNIPIMIVPVDVCADLSVKIFFNEESPFEMYNVSNPYVEDEVLLEDIAGPEFGYPVEVVEMDQFVQRVEKLAAESSNDITEIAKRGISKQKEIEELDENVPQIVSNWLAGQKNVFLSKKLVKLLPECYPACMEPAWEIVKKDLRAAKEAGIFAKIGLK